jgi:hypothetical protein
MYCIMLRAGEQRCQGRPVLGGRAIRATLGQKEEDAMSVFMQEMKLKEKAARKKEGFQNKE